ncbi:MAG: GNAT family N-acetyltransferase [Povalibacter sp.]
MNDPAHMRSRVTIRDAQAGDAEAVLQLMRQLAEFEGYLDRFAVTVDDLLKRGYDSTREPQFHISVAETAGQLIGYALTYLIPFTFDLRPTLVLKEFFVSTEHRGAGIGHMLFASVLEHGRGKKARLLRWQVLPSNDAAARFYRSFRGSVDGVWDNWVLEL